MIEKGHPPRPGFRPDAVACRHGRGWAERCHDCADHIAAVERRQRAPWYGWAVLLGVLGAVALTTLAVLALVVLHIGGLLELTGIGPVLRRLW